MTSPLVPPDVDLRGMQFIPLDTVRLLDSNLFAISTGDEFKAAVALWCKAWQQVPAASLPNDERVLSHLSGAGRRWPKLRDVALRGFVLCDDGRLYHPVIAEKAKEAWTHRLQQRAKANMRWQSHGNAAAYPTAMQGTVKGQGQLLKTSTLGPSPSAPTNARKHKKVNGEPATRIPDDWQIPDEWVAKTMEAYPQLDRRHVVLMAVEFRNYWCAVPGQKGLKTNWLRTWQNRVMKKVGDA